MIACEDLPELSPLAALRAENSRQGIDSALPTLRPASTFLSSTSHWASRYWYDGTASGKLVQRYYSPGPGRFMTADPSGDNWDISNPQSWNAYAYVNGDPINANDPEGLECSDIELYGWAGIQGGTTVGEFLSANNDLSILTKTIFTEARVAYADMNAVNEKAAIASVIMNRWQVVNGYWKLFTGPVGGRRSGEVRTVPDWGVPDGSIASIVYAPGPQFQVWAAPGTLERQSQARLDSALDSDELSVSCGSLLQSIGTGAGFWAARNQHNLYSDEGTGLVFTGFQSALPGIPPHKSWYEQWIGAYGSANLFSAVSASQVWLGNVPVPRPPQPPRRGGRGSGR